MARQAEFDLPLASRSSGRAANGFTQVLVAPTADGCPTRSFPWPRSAPLWRDLAGQKSCNGVAILARGGQPVEIRRSLPGDPDDTHSRYIEAAIDGMIVLCL
jgi:hypothetical protein